MNYRITDIDPDLWQAFKALAALEKVTIREKLIWFIQREVEIFHTQRNHQGIFHDDLKKGT